MNPISRTMPRRPPITGPAIHALLELPELPGKGVGEGILFDEETRANVELVTVFGTPVEFNR
jgi:hypothetical protein